MLKHFWYLTVFAALGCGGVKTYPVQGTVTWLDGSPAKELAGGMVQFDLVTGDPKKAVSPRGTIREDGGYRLATFKEADGAPAGKYRVVVVPVIWTEGMLGDKPPPPPVLDPKYQDFQTSKIEVAVEAKSNNIPIKVERFKKK